LFRRRLPRRPSRRLLCASGGGLANCPTSRRSAQPLGLAAGVEQAARGVTFRRSRVSAAAGLEIGAGPSQVAELPVDVGEFGAPVGWDGGGDGSTTTLAEWVGEWWTAAVHLRPSTHSRYERDLRLHLLPRFGDRALATITPREVRAWVAEMVAEGVPPSGINRRLRLFSRLMNAAVETELLARSPAKGVRAPQPIRTEARFLTASEVRDLAEAINPSFRVWVYLAAYTGVRWSEMLGLRRKDFDLLRRTVTVERQLLEVQSRFVGFGPPKSAAGRRTITLPGFLATLLEEQLAEPAQPGPDGLVFANTVGNPPHASGFTAFTWARAKRRAGLEGVRWHDLRHTAVALVIEQGAHAKAIQERMGHASVSVTLDRYGHLLPSLGERIADGLDSSFRSADQRAPVVAPVAEIRSRRVSG
jgi:integrase